MYMGTRRRESRVRTRFKQPLRKTFIREWREFRGRTLEETAEAIGPHLPAGITHATLSRIERGRSPYNQRQIEALAKYLETSIASLLVRSPKDDDFWGTFDNLGPDQQLDVSNYANYVREKSAKSGA